MTAPDNPVDVLGVWPMRRGDRLPMFALRVEDQYGQPVDLSGAAAWFLLRHEDNLAVLSPDPEQPIGIVQDGVLTLPAYIYDGPGGVVIYDWPDWQTERLTIGVLDLQVRVEWPDGRALMAPTDRDARIGVRPSLVPAQTELPPMPEVAVPASPQGRQPLF